jgi:hypothetical protein
VPEDVTRGGLGVAGQGDDLDVGLSLENHANPVANELVIVGQDDGYRPGGRGGFGICAHTGTLIIAAHRS